MVVVDQPATIGALPVAHLSGLAVRRISDLHPAERKLTPITALGEQTVTVRALLPRLADSLKTVLRQRTQVADQVEGVLDAHLLPRS